MLLAFIGGIGLQELLVILLIVVFLFGARKIPEIARGLGEGIRGFRTSLRGDDADDPDAATRDETGATGKDRGDRLDR